MERARAGVKVHLMLDFIGSLKMDDKSLADLRAAGVQVQRYHKPVWWKLTRLNNRTHRKVLVVDGAFGFTGGVGHLIVRGLDNGSRAPSGTAGGLSRRHG